MNSAAYLITITAPWVKAWINAFQARTAQPQSNLPLPDHQCPPGHLITIFDPFQTQVWGVVGSSSTKKKSDSKTTK